MSFQRGGFRPFGRGGLMGSPMGGPPFGPRRGGLQGSRFGSPMVRPPPGGFRGGGNMGGLRPPRPQFSKDTKFISPARNTTFQKTSPATEQKKDTKVDGKDDKKEEKKDDNKEEKKDDKQEEKRDDIKDDKKEEKKDDKKDDKGDAKEGKTPAGKDIKVEPLDKNDQKIEEKKDGKQKEVNKDSKEESKKDPNAIKDEKPTTKSVTKNPEIIKTEFPPANVTLDRLNCELHLAIESDGLTAGNMQGDGFQFMWAGVRGSHGVSKGKVCYEVHILENIKVHCPDEKSPHVCRVGWSVDNSDFQLGEDKLSWGYGGTAKSSYDSKFLDYGKRYTVGDVVTCYIDLDARPRAIFFMLNGEYLGVAYRFGNELEEKAVFPHVTCKNMRFRVNFGKEKPKHNVTNGFRMLQDIPPDQLDLPSPSPKSPKEAEIIMMVGLPACGKSFWCEKYAKEHPNKKYYILGTNNIIDRMKVSGLLRKRNYHGRWEELIKRASLVLNKLFTVTKNNPRNYILDQTNVYFTARRRKMEAFAGYKKIAAVMVNKPDVLATRTEKQQKVEGKIVPEAAVMEMKYNFTLPEKGPSFDDVWYLEESLPKAQELVATYRREGSNFKNEAKRKPDSQTKPESSPVSEKKPKLDQSRGFDKPFSKPDDLSKQVSGKDSNIKTPGQSRFSNNEKAISSNETQNNSNPYSFNRNLEGSANRDERKDRQFPPREENRNTPAKHVRGTLDHLQTLVNREAAGATKDHSDLRDPTQFSRPQERSSLMDVDRPPRRDGDNFQSPQFRNRDQLGSMGGRGRGTPPSRSFNDFRNQPQGPPDFRSGPGIGDSSRNSRWNEYQPPGGRGPNEFNEGPARGNFPHGGRGPNDFTDSSSRGGFTPTGRGGHNDFTSRGAFAGGRGGSMMRSQDSANDREELKRNEPSFDHFQPPIRKTRFSDAVPNKYDPVGNRGGFNSESGLKGFPPIAGNQGYKDPTSRLDDPSRFDRMNPQSEPSRFDRNNMNESSRFDRPNQQNEPSRFDGTNTQNEQSRFGRAPSQGNNEPKPLMGSLFSQEDFKKHDSFSSFEKDGGFKESPKPNDPFGSNQQRKEERFDQPGREPFQGQQRDPSTNYSNYRNQAGQREFQDGKFNAGGANSNEQYQNKNYQQGYPPQNNNSQFNQYNQSSRPYNQEQNYDKTSEFGRSRAPFERGDQNSRSDDMNRNNNRRYGNEFQENDPMGNYSTSNQAFGRPQNQPERPNFDRGPQSQQYPHNNQAPGDGRQGGSDFRSVSSSNDKEPNQYSVSSSMSSQGYSFTSSSNKANDRVSSSSQHPQMTTSTANYSPMQYGNNNQRPFNEPPSKSDPWQNDQKNYSANMNTSNNYNSPASSNYGNPTPSNLANPATSNYGSSAPSNYGNPANSNYGNSMPSNFGNPATSNYGNSNPSNYVNPPSSNYGNSTPSNFGNPVTSSYGNTGPSNYGNPPTSNYGNSTSSSYGSPATSNYGNATPSSYGNATPSSYGNATPSNYGGTPNYGNTNYSTPSSSYYGNTTTSSYVNTSASVYGSTPTSNYGSSSSSNYGSTATTNYGGSSATVNYGNTATSNYGSTPTSNYGSAPTPNYGSAPAPNYGNTPTPNYGSAPAPNYGSTPTPNYGSTPTPNYGTTPTTNYGTTATSNYGSTATSNYGSTATSNYGSSTTTYGSTPSTSYGGATTPGYGSTTAPSYGGTPTSSYGNTNTYDNRSASNPAQSYQGQQSYPGQQPTMNQPYGQQPAMNSYQKQQPSANQQYQSQAAPVNPSYQAQQPPVSQTYQAQNPTLNQSYQGQSYQTQSYQTQNTSYQTQQPSVTQPYTNQQPQLPYQTQPSLNQGYSNAQPTVTQSYSTQPPSTQPSYPSQQPSMNTQMYQTQPTPSNQYTAQQPTVTQPYQTQPIMNQPYQSQQTTPYAAPPPTAGQQMQSYEKQQEDYEKAYKQWYDNYAQAFAQLTSGQPQPPPQ